MSDSRIMSIVNDLVSASERILEKHRVSVEEYHAAVSFLNEVAGAGQIPLLLDLFLEARVVEANSRNRWGTAYNLRGPYYLEGAPNIEGGRLASESEEGERLTVSGVVRDIEGKALRGAVLDFWQADGQGRYSGFDPGLPKMNLRGRLRSGEDGSYVLHTVRPAAYTIPHEGPMGRVLEALGRHPWRSAHIHLRASHEGCRSLITQIYFADSDYLDSDAANAIRDELVRPVSLAGSGSSLDFDIVLVPDS